MEATYMLNMMSEEQRGKRKFIKVTGSSRMKNAEFIQEIFQAFEEGYVLPPMDGLWTVDAPVLKKTRKQVALYPKGYEVPKAGVGSPSAKSDEEVIAEANEAILAEIKAEEEEEKLLTTDTGDTSDEPEDVKVDDDVAPTPEESESEPEQEVVEGTPEAPKTPTAEDRINSLTKKAPLLALAKELGIEIPEDKSKYPAAIKQFLLTATAE